MLQFRYVHLDVRFVAARTMTSPSALGRMGAFTVPFSTRVAASLVDLANVAATKRSFDVARPIAIVVRAIANDPSGEVQQTSWPR